MSWLNKHIFKSWNMKYMCYSIFALSLVLTSILTFDRLGLVQTMGWIYSITFAISAIPEALSAMENGRVKMTDGTLLCWVAGEISGLIYGIGLGQWPLIFNCAVNAIFVSIIVKYRLFPKR